jgi:hypothetical protein
VIYELRIYTLKPGAQAEYVRLQAEVGRPIREDRFGTMVGAWTTEFGTLNQYVHMWSFPDPIERERLRAGLQRDERWAKEFIAPSRHLLMAQENMLLYPVDGVPFSPPSGGKHVYELRSYRTQPGKVAAWTDLFKGVLPTRREYSTPVGMWTTDAGPLNRVVHLWSYDDLNHRAQVRSDVAQHPRWHEFVPQSSELLLEMSSVVLMPCPHSPLQ